MISSPGSHLSARRRIATFDLSALDVAAFLVPAVSFLEITIVGRLIVTEILLLAMIPWLWRVRDRLQMPRWFVVLWAGWLVSQIVTDLVVGSAFRDYARGWAGIFFTLTNFAGILVLASTPRRARLFALGLATAGFAGAFVAPHLYAALDPWKWAFALPVGLVVAAALSGPAGARLRWLPVAAFAAFGIVNLLLGYRSLGGVSLLAAGYLGLNALVTLRGSAGPSVLRAALGLVFVAVAGLGVIGVYSVAASQGLLGPEAQTKYLEQSGPLGAVLGGRAELLVSTQAIIDSPVIGHGSWANDPRYAELLAERQESLGYEVTPEYVGTNLIPAHSYLMGTWVWAGVLGAAFWFGVAAVAIWLLANLYSYRAAIAPLIVFSTVLLLWDIAFSPYGHSARITAPYGLALCLLGLGVIREMGVTRRSADPSADPLQRSRPRPERPAGDPEATYPRSAHDRLAADR